MVSAPVRTRAPIAEKYIAMRTQSFTRTHAQRLQRWLDDGRGSEADYFAWFQQEVMRTARKWEQDCAAIDRDPNLSFREKRAEKDKLTRLWPSWTMEQEERFIAQWGDPRRVDRGRLEGLLIDLQSPQWDNAMRGGQIQVVDKKDWERKFYDAVVNPQDGSVPLYMTVAEVAPPVPLPESTFNGSPSSVLPIDDDLDGGLSLQYANVPQPPEVEIKAPDLAGLYLTDRQQSEFQEHMKLVAKRTCPLCRAYFPKGLKPQHVGGAGCKAAQEALAK